MVPLEVGGDVEQVVALPLRDELVDEEDGRLPPQHRHRPAEWQRWWRLLAAATFDGLHPLLVRVPARGVRHVHRHPALEEDVGLRVCRALLLVKGVAAARRLTLAHLGGLRLAHVAVELVQWVRVIVIGGKKASNVHKPRRVVGAASGPQVVARIGRLPEPVAVPLLFRQRRAVVESARVVAHDLTQLVRERVPVVVVVATVGRERLILMRHDGEEIVGPLPDMLLLYFDQVADDTVVEHRAERVAETHRALLARVERDLITVMIDIRRHIHRMVDRRDLPASADQLQPRNDRRRQCEEAYHWE